MREKILHITQQFYVFLLLIVFATTNMSLGAIFMKKFSHYKTRKEIAKIVQQYENKQNECKCQAETENPVDTKANEQPADEQAEKIEEQANDEQVMKMLMDGDPMKTLSNKNEGQIDEIIKTRKSVKKTNNTNKTLEQEEKQKYIKNDFQQEPEVYEQKKENDIKVSEKKVSKKETILSEEKEKTQPKKNFNLVKKNKNMQQIRKNNRTIEIIF